MSLPGKYIIDYSIYSGSKWEHQPTVFPVRLAGRFFKRNATSEEGKFMF